MKKIFLAALSTAVALTMVGCKSKNEKRGDEFLEKGNFNNAVSSYINAQKKGNVSEDFNDNFVLALTRAADKFSQINRSDDAIARFDMALSVIDSVKKPEVVEEYVKTVVNVCKKQIDENSTDFSAVIEFFSRIDATIDFAKRHGVGEASAKAVRTEAANSYVSANLAAAEAEEDPVSREYHLLKLGEVAPDHPEVKEALNKVFKANRNVFCLFSEDYLGEKPHRRIDKNGYLFAFLDFKMNKTSITGQLQVGSTTGTDVEFDPNQIKLVSTTGAEVNANTNGGWCDVDEINLKTGLTKEKRITLKKGQAAKLQNRKKCGFYVTFSYANDFVPDYVEFKDNSNYIGRKYIGQ